MHKLTKNAKIFIVSLLVIFGFGAWIFAPKNTPKQVAGAHSENDPNHPEEIYYGEADLKTLEAMLNDLKVTVYPEDKVNTFPPPEMGLGSRIIITRAAPVNVTDAKKLTTYRTWAQNIQGLLAEQNIGLLEQDSVVPSQETPISIGMQIKITRVAELDITLKEEIDFKTTKKNNPDMERGQNTVEQKGVKGQKEVTYHIKRVDGEEVSRKMLETKILEEPVTEILIVGTGPKQVHSGPYVDLLNAAAKKSGVNATALQCLMIRESGGGAQTGFPDAYYKGLFQYEEGYWAAASDRAGFGGASIYDAKAQIFTTANEIANGQSRRWPPYAHCVNL